MANSLTQNPIIVTAAMAQGWKAAVASALGSPLGGVRVKQIYWQGPVTLGDTVTIIDPANSATRYFLKAATAGLDIVRDFNSQPLVWDDFEVSQISSGTLYLYWSM